MAGFLSFKGSNKKKIDVIRKQKTTECKVICICSATSTIHVLVPLLKVLGKLGTVNVISEDKSVLLLSPTMSTSFSIGDISIEQSDELYLLDESSNDSFKEYDYTILITHDYLPSCGIDKYIMLSRRHHYREQLNTKELRYIPIFSVFNPRTLSKEEQIKEKERVYVNESLMPLPSFAVTQDYLNSLLMGVGSKQFKINEKILMFIVDCLSGIENCTKNHIKQLLLERGDIFDSTS